MTTLSDNIVREVVNNNNTTAKLPAPVAASNAPQAITDTMTPGLRPADQTNVNKTVDLADGKHTSDPPIYTTRDVIYDDAEWGSVVPGTRRGWVMDLEIEEMDRIAAAAKLWPKESGWWLDPDNILKVNRSIIDHLRSRKRPQIVVGSIDAQNLRILASWGWQLIQVRLNKEELRVNLEARAAAGNVLQPGPAKLEDLWRGQAQAGRVCDVSVDNFDKAVAQYSMGRACFIHAVSGAGKSHWFGRQRKVARVTATTEVVAVRPSVASTAKEWVIERNPGPKHQRTEGPRSTRSHFEHTFPISILQVVVRFLRWERGDLARLAGLTTGWRDLMKGDWSRFITDFPFPWKSGETWQQLTRRLAPAYRLLPPTRLPFQMLHLQTIRDLTESFGCWRRCFSAHVFAGGDSFVPTMCCTDCMDQMPHCCATDTGGDPQQERFQLLWSPTQRLDLSCRMLYHCLVQKACGPDVECGSKASCQQIVQFRMDFPLADTTVPVPGQPDFHRSWEIQRRAFKVTAPACRHGTVAISLLLREFGTYYVWSKRGVALSHSPSNVADCGLTFERMMNHARHAEETCEEGDIEWFDSISKNEDHGRGIAGAACCNLCRAQVDGPAWAHVEETAATWHGVDHTAKVFTHEYYVYRDLQGRSFSDVWQLCNINYTGDDNQSLDVAAACVSGEPVGTSWSHGAREAGRSNGLIDCCGSRGSCLKEPEAPRATLAAQMRGAKLAFDARPSLPLHEIAAHDESMLRLIKPVIVDLATGLAQLSVSLPRTSAAPSASVTAPAEEWIHNSVVFTAMQQAIEPNPGPGRDADLRLFVDPDAADLSLTPWRLSIVLLALSVLFTRATAYKPFVCDLTVSHPNGLASDWGSYVFTSSDTIDEATTQCHRLPARAYTGTFRWMMTNTAAIDFAKLHVALMMTDGDYSWWQWEVVPATANATVLWRHEVQVGPLEVSGASPGGDGHIHGAVIPIMFDASRLSNITFVAVVHGIVEKSSYVSSTAFSFVWEIAPVLPVRPTGKPGLLQPPRTLATDVPAAAEPLTRFRTHQFGALERWDSLHSGKCTASGSFNFATGETVQISGAIDLSTDESTQILAGYVFLAADDISSTAILNALEQSHSSQDIYAFCAADVVGGFFLDSTGSRVLTVEHCSLTSPKTALSSKLCFVVKTSTNTVINANPWLHTVFQDVRSASSSAAGLQQVNVTNDGRHPVPFYTPDGYAANVRTAGTDTVVIEKCVTLLCLVKEAAAGLAIAEEIAAAQASGSLSPTFVRTAPNMPIDVRLSLNSTSVVGLTSDCGRQPCRNTTFCTMLPCLVYQCAHTSVTTVFVANETLSLAVELASEWSFAARRGGPYTAYGRWAVLQRGYSIPATLCFSAEPGLRQLSVQTASVSSTGLGGCSGGTDHEAVTRRVVMMSGDRLLWQLCSQRPLLAADELEIALTVDKTFEPTTELTAMLEVLVNTAKRYVVEKNPGPRHGEVALRDGLEADRDRRAAEGDEKVDRFDEAFRSAILGLPSTLNRYALLATLNKECELPDLWLNEYSDVEAVSAVGDRSTAMQPRRPMSGKRIESGGRIFAKQEAGPPKSRPDKVQQLQAAKTRITSRLRTRNDLARYLMVNRCQRWFANQLAADVKEAKELKEKDNVAELVIDWFCGTIEPRAAFEGIAAHTKALADFTKDRAYPFWLGTAFPEAITPAASRVRVDSETAREWVVERNPGPDLASGSAAARLGGAHWFMSSADWQAKMHASNGNTTEAKIEVSNPGSGGAPEWDRAIAANTGRSDRKIDSEAITGMSNDTKATFYDDREVRLYRATRVTSAGVVGPTTYPLPGSWLDVRGRWTGAGAGATIVFSFAPRMCNIQLRRREKLSKATIATGLMQTITEGIAPVKGPKLRTTYQNRFLLDLAQLTLDVKQVELESPNWQSLMIRLAQWVLTGASTRPVKTLPLAGSIATFDDFARLSLDAQGDPTAAAVVNVGVNYGEDLGGNANQFMGVPATPDNNQGRGFLSFHITADTVRRHQALREHQIIYYPYEALSSVERIRDLYFCGLLTMLCAKATRESLLINTTNDAGAGPFQQRFVPFTENIFVADGLTNVAIVMPTITDDIKMPADGAAASAASAATFTSGPRGYAGLPAGTVLANFCGPPDGNPPPTYPLAAVIASYDFSYTERMMATRWWIDYLGCYADARFAFELVSAESVRYPAMLRLDPNPAVARQVPDINDANKVAAARVQTGVYNFEFADTQNLLAAPTVWHYHVPSASLPLLNYHCVGLKTLTVDGSSADLKPYEPAAAPVTIMMDRAMCYATGVDAVVERSTMSNALWDVVLNGNADEKEELIATWSSFAATAGNQKPWEGPAMAPLLAGAVASLTGWQPAKDSFGSTLFDYRRFFGVTNGQHMFAPFNFSLAADGAAGLWAQSDHVIPLRFNDLDRKLITQNAKRAAAYDTDFGLPNQQLKLEMPPKAERVRYADGSWTLPTIRSGLAMNSSSLPDIEPHEMRMVRMIQNLLGMQLQTVTKANEPINLFNPNFITQRPICRQDWSLNPDPGHDTSKIWYLRNTAWLPFYTNDGHAIFFKCAVALDRITLNNLLLQRTTIDDFTALNYYQKVPKVLNFFSGGAANKAGLEGIRKSGNGGAASG